VNRHNARSETEQITHTTDKTNFALNEGTMGLKINNRLEGNRLF